MWRIHNGRIRLGSTTMHWARAWVDLDGTLRVTYGLPYDKQHQDNYQPCTRPQACPSGSRWQTETI